MEEINKDLKVIIFQLEEQEYAIPVDQVSSIERLERITRIPQTREFIKGVINLRGVVIPVVDLRARFELEEKVFNEATRIIIVHVNEIEIGLIVDAASDVIDIPVEVIEPAPEVVGAVHVDYINGIAKIEKRLLILLDLGKVLSMDEIVGLKHVEE